MEKHDVQKILNYYLEFEIYNIMNSSKIKIDKKKCMVVEDILDIQKVSQHIRELKEIKITQLVGDFIGEKNAKESAIVKQITEQLKELNIDQSNKAQIFFRIKSLIKENCKYKREDKMVDKFVDNLCDTQVSKVFWLYAHNITIGYKNESKMPIFILKCSMETTNIEVIEVNVNKETLNTILSIILKEEISEIVLKYEEQISNYAEEIKRLIDAGDIPHLLEIYYLKLKEYLQISREQIKQIERTTNYYKLHDEYIISLDAIAEEGVKYIKEDIETLIKMIDYDGYVPRVLNKYLCGSENKKDINEPKYNQIYRGNYKSTFGVNEKQYQIVNVIKDNDIVAIEGPPGTGKTSLLKEIISNNIVEKANLLLKNWDENLELKKYNSTNYYKINWYNTNENVVKSIIVSSKNSEAIENVGREINKEIKYMFPIARKYVRTERNGEVQEKIIPNYKGLVCLPLGKQDNMQDFKEFLYQKYIPCLKKIVKKEDIESYAEKVKKLYENKSKEVTIAESLITSMLKRTEERTQYFYGIQILPEDTEEQKSKKMEEIEKRFLEDEEIKIKELGKLESDKISLLEQQEEKRKQLYSIKEEIVSREKQISDTEKNIIEGRNNIEYWEGRKKRFEVISKNLFTKLSNYKEYKENKNINFTNDINEMITKNETECKKVSYYIEEKEKIEKEQKVVKNQYKELTENYKNVENNYSILKEKMIGIKCIKKFNQWNKKPYWHYTSKCDIYGRSFLNKLNQELFEMALKLNEAYIIKNSKEIIENLQLFLEEGTSYTCSRFYDSTERYNKEKQEGIRSLWNTLFLCFPVVTTTLDSFSKRYFHLIPEYIDLELIDEAGQILPHNLVSALYRTKKAVIVGDVNQIEPICSKFNKDFFKRRQEIGEKFENIEVSNNSIQTLANRNTDILDNGENIILNEHYRCEKNIINFSNQNVYGKKLNMHKEDKKAKPFLSNMIALDVRGKKEQNCYANNLEIDSCIETVKYIIEQTKKENSKEEPTIAIITPFKKQKELLENRLEKEKLHKIKVGTIHAFQGQEKDYIIFSQVIDSLYPKSIVNFIAEKCNMLNVAVTRAKKQFIYLGNLGLAMKADNYMTKLIKYIKKNGLLYSLYDMEESALVDKWDERILQILQPVLELENDKIGIYISQHSEKGLIKDAKQHYELLKYAIKNAKSEIFIMAPWIRKNVINDEFINDIKKLKDRNCRIKIVYGYKKVNTNVSSIEELVVQLKKSSALGYASEEEVREIIEEMYKQIGRENFICNGPTHAKIFIIDGKYMLIGSHNWLSNAGKIDEKERAIEGTIITTSKSAIDYAKSEFFKFLGV